jgi:hypothetical protein
MNVRVCVTAVTKPWKKIISSERYLSAKKNTKMCNM